MQVIKSILKSKTIIVNTLTVIVGVGGYLAGHEVIAQNPEVVSALVAAVGVLNVALRFITTLPVWEK